MKFYKVTWEDKEHKPRIAWATTKTGARKLQTRARRESPRPCFLVMVSSCELKTNRKFDILDFLNTHTNWP